MNLQIKIASLLAFIIVFSNNDKLIAQCASATNIYTFTYNGSTYEVVRENKSWIDAAACAVARGGYLAEINDMAEQNAIYTELSSNASIVTGNTIAPDGGGASYVWIGANDLGTEGVWIWDGDNNTTGPQFWQGTTSGNAVGGLYNNWGNEPDNFNNNQDAAGIALTNWPLGVAGEWNDVDHTNTLYYIIEIDVNDNIPPVPDLNMLPDIYEECYLVSPTIPTATDNIVGTINGVSDISFPLLTEGNYQVTWTYTDPSGNSVDQIQNITIDDTTAPVFDMPVLPDFSSACSVDSIPVPTATDFCTGSVDGVLDTPLPITTLGTTVVTWTYDDGRGNMISQTQNIIIHDTVPPVPNIAGLPDINHNCIVSDLTAPEASDNCTGIITGTHDAVLPIQNQGTTVITWTYDDGNGNQFMQTQNVIINPAFDSVVLDNLTLTLTAYENNATYQWLDCDNNYSPIANATAQSFTVTENGNYAVEITSGNCVDTSNCFIVADLGLNEMASPLFNVYPNPTEGQISISATKESLPYNVIIRSIDGKIVDSINNLSKTTENTDIKGNKGLYIIELHHSNRISYYKVFKE